jgi:glycine/D-amino acid oxidase-like deaminating enzyme
VQIFENSRVEELVQTKTAVIAHTAYGEVHAQKVALATNVYPALIKKTRKYIVPVYDYQIVTEPLTPAQLESIGWKDREGVSDSGNQFHYYRLTDENCIVWGGWDAIYNFRGKVRQEYEARPETYAKLAAHFLRTFPQLEGIKFTHVWGGAIDTCTRFSPFWTVSKDKRIATVLGYTGLGVAATRFGGQVMLDLLDGLDNERTRLEMVRKKPLAFPPEPFRYLIIQITRWAINRADEHNGKRNLWLRFLDRLGLGFDS